MSSFTFSLQGNVGRGDWRFDNLSGSHLQSQVTTKHLTLKMTSAQVTDNSPSQDYTHLDDPTTLLHVTPGSNHLLYKGNCIKTAKNNRESISFPGRGNCEVSQSRLYLTNRFQVAVRLFNNRSQTTSKCGKNKKVSRCSYHILTSSVIYYWTDAQQLGI